jgi:hypothetical protein
MLGFIRLNTRDWEYLSPEGLHFMRCLCSYLPRKRPSAEEAKQHEWFYIQLEQ